MACPSSTDNRGLSEQSHKHEHLKTTELPLPHTCSSTSPYLTSNWFKSLTFSWLDPLLRVGNKRALQLSDVPCLAPEDEAATLYNNAFVTAWAEQRKGRSSPSEYSSSALNASHMQSKGSSSGKKASKNPASQQPSIVKALAKCFWKLALRTGLCALVRAVAMTSGPIVLLLFVDYTSGEELFSGEGYVLVICLFLAKTIESLAQRHWCLGCRRLGFQLRSAVIAAVFDKELRLSSIGRRNHAAGNYIAVDAYRLGEFPWYMHYIWSDLLLSSLTVLLNTPLARSLQKCQTEFMKGQDERLRATMEVLNNMKVLKLQAWEDRFREQVEHLREEEYKWLSKAQSRSHWMHQLCSVIATFKMIQEPVKMIPEVMASYAQVSVSLERLGRFLNDDELPSDAAQRTFTDKADFVIRVCNCTLAWNAESPKPTLNNINLAFKAGEKIAVCGTVGSGKSSLLLALLGEIPKLSGDVMQGGEIQQSGRYHDLLHAGETFEQLVNAHQDALTSVSFGDSARTDDGYGEMNAMQRQMSQRKSSLGNNQGEAVQLVQEEKMETGDMGLKPYKAYITYPKAATVLIFMTLVQILFIVFQVLSNFWLANEVSNSGISQGLLVGIFAVLSVASGVFVHVRSTSTVRLGLKASKEFFYGMTRTMFRAPMSFFDSTPTGRILSRVSTDSSILDLDIPFCVGFVMAGSIELLGILVVIAAVTWEILLVSILMLYIAHRLQHYYVRSGQELMRINASTKAPIVNFSGEANQGAATIRAFQMVERFKRKNFALIDNDASLYIHANAAIESLIMWLEFLSNIVLCATGLSLVIFPVSSSGFAGLALPYGLSLSAIQVFIVQWQCKLVSYVVSVERIDQYLYLPSEAPLVIEDRRPPKQWPNKGCVVLEDLQIRYQPTLPLVLRGITCTFEGGKRIGVVGLGIIPQEPTLFRGTVRTNLDPLNQYSDDAIWQALDRCQLGNIIRESPFQLEAPVRDEGENWSSGQRQLFCLGRVLLKESKILVLDEATASIDSQTDAVLQKSLHFGMEKLIEYDKPSRLLEDENSLFARLVKDCWSHANHAGNNKAS
ncbi:hypothetical protein GOP47_0001594 [Adiantum capillus-veneris]|uniref:ABC transmembrane type-1 domain-containing protein n=1 Tax=Adiantum capillus-veneris TaxID=13818 RepID=A0A9D4ZQ65_ADICA|nr:hypothetical protein GOP47_0001594 [Adiantum capillus-veneris]